LRSSRCHGRDLAPAPIYIIACCEYRGVAGGCIVELLLAAARTSKHLQDKPPCGTKFRMPTYNESSCGDAGVSSGTLTTTKHLVSLRARFRVDASMTRWRIQSCTRNSLCAFQLVVVAFGERLFAQQKNLALKLDRLVGQGSLQRGDRTRATKRFARSR